MNGPYAGLPRARVPRVSAAADRFWTQGGPGAIALAPFGLADGSAPALQQTAVRLAHDGRALFVRFDCADRDIWGTHTRRDDPLYAEEAVELFLAPGAADPTDYFEFEVSPHGVLFDARVRNPTSRRVDLAVDTAWDCPGVSWSAVADPANGAWWAELAIPWVALAPDPPAAVWRANFHRIERPRDGAPEFSSWSPTLTAPPDFHRPARFGLLEVERVG